MQHMTYIDVIVIQTPRHMIVGQLLTKTQTYIICYQ